MFYILEQDFICPKGLPSGHMAWPVAWGHLCPCPGGPSEELWEGTQESLEKTTLGTAVILIRAAWF